MRTYNESIDIKSSSLESGGAGKRRVAENKDPEANADSNPEQTSQPVPAKPSSSISPIRTFASDTERATAEGSASLASSYVEQQEKGSTTASQQPPQKPEPDRSRSTSRTHTPPVTPKKDDSFGAPHPDQKRSTRSTRKTTEPEGSTLNAIFFIVSLILCGGAAYMLLPFIGISVPAPSLPSFSFGDSPEVSEEESFLPNPLLSTTSTQSMSTDTANANEIIEEINALRNEQSDAQATTAIYLTTERSNVDATAENEEAREILSAAEFFSVFDLSADAILPRVIENYTFGIISSEDTFLVARISSYDNARGSLYTWEETMANDLDRLFQLNNSVSSNNAVFQDRIISGIDTRTLSSETPESTEEDSETEAAVTETLTYAFPTDDMLVIASSVDAFERVVTLLE